jgi:hypothetical protein
MSSRALGQAIKSAVHAKTMPPWFRTPITAVANERKLTPAEIQTLSGLGFAPAGGQPEGCPARAHV